MNRPTSVEEDLACGFHHCPNGRRGYLHLTMLLEKLGYVAPHLFFFLSLIGEPQRIGCNGRPPCDPGPHLICVTFKNVGDFWSKNDSLKLVFFCGLKILGLCVSCRIDCVCVVVAQVLYT